MLSKKVIAQNITNLTDARYFAAWGVDYLSYNMIPNSDYEIHWDTIQEIVSWVEGPKTLIETNGLDHMEDIDGHILNISFSSLPLVNEAFFRISPSALDNGLANGNYIIKFDHRVEKILANISSMDLIGSTIYLDITDFDFQRLDDLPEGDGIGLVVQGGDEEKIGVKSYDNLDILYDWLLP